MVVVVVLRLGSPGKLRMMMAVVITIKCFPLADRNSGSKI